ncbi:MAG: hypothetical protein U0572_18740 [Phycisphaerales bacterium]
MRILVDDRECSVSASNVAQALAAAADVAESQGRRVVDVFVDGQLWSDAEFGDSARLGGEAAEIRCTTACPRALLRETFLGAVDALGEASQLQETAARALQSGDSRAGMGDLTGALERWMNVQKAASQGIAFSGIDPRGITTAEGSFEDAAADLNIRLAGLRDAMRDGDIVAVCDCLLYEFPATTRRWTAVLSELARRAESMNVMASSNPSASRSAS